MCHLAEKYKKKKKYYSISQPSHLHSPIRPTAPANTAPYLFMRSGLSKSAYVNLFPSTASKKVQSASFAKASRAWIPPTTIRFCSAFARVNASVYFFASRPKSWAILRSTSSLMPFKSESTPAIVLPFNVGFGSGGTAIPFIFSAAGVTGAGEVGVASSCLHEEMRISSEAYANTLSIFIY